MILSFCTGISFTPPFPGGSIHKETLQHGKRKEKKICVSEMTVEVGISLFVLDVNLGNLRVFPYNRDDTAIYFPS